MLTRRQFSKSLLAGGTAALTAPHLASAAASSVTSPATPQNQRVQLDCDLLLKGGTVIDPGQRMHAVMDVAVKNGKILEVSQNIAENRAVRVISAKGRIVTPGLIDVHVHAFDGFGGMNADHSCLGRGVTTVVDAGSAGYLTIAAFVKYISTPSVTRVYPLVNIAALGLLVGGSNKKLGTDSSDGFMGAMDNPDWIYPEQTARAAAQCKPTLVGVKARLESSVQGSRDKECLKNALQVAEAIGLPMMAHIDMPYSPLPEILKMMRKGDVYTHIYNNHPHGIFDSDGKVSAEVREARQRGIFMDCAQGRTHFSWDTVEKALQQDFLPDSISTDLTPVSTSERVFDLPTMVSKFLAMGMDLDKAIACVTINPSKMFNYGVQIGTLRPGYEADIAVFEMQDGKYEFVDSDGKTRPGKQLLVNKSVVCRGQLFMNEV
jgi:dihydroorotase